MSLVQEWPERLRAVVVHNLGLKAVSLFAALVLYSSIHGSQDAARTVAVDVVAVLPPSQSNRVLTSPLPSRARITLRGSRTVLDDLHADDIGNLQLDVHRGTDRRLVLDASMVHVPPGVHVDQIDPPTVDLVWEDEIVRDVPVQVSVVGAPASGFVVKAFPTADPSTVRVHGPKSELLLLQHVRADAFDVSGLTEGAYSRDLRLDTPGSRMLFDVPTVKASCEITREIAERPFTKVPVAVLGQTKAKTQPAEVDVRLACPPEILRSLRPEQVVPRVEVTSTASSGSIALPVNVNVDRCEAHVTPSTVVVRW